MKLFLFQTLLCFIFTSLVAASPINDTSAEALEKRVMPLAAQLDKEPISRTFVVNHTTPAEMSDMVCNMLLPAHGMGEGGKSGGKSDGYVPPVPGVGTSFVTGGAASTEGGSSSSGGGGTMSQVKIGEGIDVASDGTISTDGTTYTFTSDVNGNFIVTPENGTPQTVTVLPIGSEGNGRYLRKNSVTGDLEWAAVSGGTGGNDGCPCFTGEKPYYLCYRRRFRLYGRAAEKSGFPLVFFQADLYPSDDPRPAGRTDLPGVQDQQGREVPLVKCIRHEGMEFLRGKVIKIMRSTGF